MLARFFWYLCRNSHHSPEKIERLSRPSHRPKIATLPKRPRLLTSYIIEAQKWKGSNRSRMRAGKKIKTFKVSTTQNLRSLYVIIIKEIVIIQLLLFKNKIYIPVQNPMTRADVTAGHHARPSPSPVSPLSSSFNPTIPSFLL